MNSNYTNVSAGFAIKFVFSSTLFILNFVIAENNIELNNNKFTVIIKVIVTKITSK